MWVGFEVTNDRRRSMADCNSQHKQFVVDPDRNIQACRSKRCTNDLRPVKTVLLLFPQMLTQRCIEACNSNG